MLFYCERQDLIFAHNNFIKPDIHALNEDGDKPEKRKYYQEHGLKFETPAQNRATKKAKHRVTWILAKEVKCVAH